MWLETGGTGNLSSGEGHRESVFWEGEPSWGTQAGWAEEALSQRNHQDAAGGGWWWVHTVLRRQFGKWWMGEAFFGKTWLALSVTSRHETAQNPGPHWLLCHSAALAPRALTPCKLSFFLCKMEARVPTFYWQKRFSTPTPGSPQKGQKRLIICLVLVWEGRKKVRGKKIEVLYLVPKSLTETQPWLLPGSLLRRPH